jgi:hypothetical protein
MGLGIDKKGALSTAEELIVKEADELFNALIWEFLNEHKRVLQDAIRNAEKGDDDEKLAKYLKAFDDVVRKMQDISNGK